VSHQNRTFEFMTPSRLAAMTSIQQSLAAGRRTILLTGEAGSGKSWILRQLQLLESTLCEWLVVDLAPLLEPSEFLELVQAQLGIPSGNGRSVSGRLLAIAGRLTESSYDGHSFVLVVEEAHLCSARLLDLIRVFGNQLGSESGLAGLILCGQSSLRRRLGLARFAGLRARLSAAVQLPPIDADEAGQLLEHTWPAQAWSADLIERLHRDSRGNPSRLLRLGASLATDSSSQTETSASTIKPFEAPQKAKDLAVARAFSNHDPESSLASTFEGLDEFSKRDLQGHSPAQGGVESAPWIPSRPPLVSEENAIEVGWDQDIEPDTAEAEEALPSVRPMREAAPPRLAPQLEPIVDAYAVLQAALANEIANELGASWHNGELARHEDDEVEVDEPETSLSEQLQASGVVWPDAPHPFEPYGELFASKNTTSSIDP
jgi:general secretion pathway protein A